MHRVMSSVGWTRTVDLRFAICDLRFMLWVLVMMKSSA